MKTFETVTTIQDAMLECGVEVSYETARSILEKLVSYEIIPKQKQIVKNAFRKIIREEWNKPFPNKELIKELEKQLA